MTNRPGSGREPYGRAYATQLHSWTNWTNNRDFDHDIGLIDLARPVGGITGWHGYGFDVRTGECVTGQACRLPSSPRVEERDGQILLSIPD